jgi:SAM-dependent methyltransferase
VPDRTETTGFVVRDFYETEKVFESAANDRTRRALRLIAEAGPARALDIGCGDGSTAAAIRERTGAVVTGADISHRARELSAKVGIDCVVIDLNHDPLPFADDSFDLVYIGEVIEHLLDPDVVLKDIRRVLRPGGYLVLTTPNLGYLPNRLLLLLGIQPLFTEVSTEVVLGRRSRLLGDGNQPVGHLRIGTWRATRLLIERHGFVVDNIEGAGFLTGRLGFVERALLRSPALAAVTVVRAVRP